MSDFRNSSTSTTSIEFRERWEIAYDALRREILVGERLPGSRIREVEVAETLGFSRGPVREALRALEVAGLVVRRPRQATFVIPISARDIEDIYGLRDSIETYAIQLALARAPVELGTMMRQDAKCMHDARSANLHIVDVDIAFHGRFYEHCGNSRVLLVWNNLRDPLRILVGLTTNTRAQSDWERTAQGHNDILEAVLQRDVAGCVSATREHLDAARNLALSCVKSSAASTSAQ